MSGSRAGQLRWRTVSGRVRGCIRPWASSGATSRTTLPMVRRLTSNRSATGVLGAEAALVEDGAQHAFGVGDLLSEHAAAGSGQAFPAAAAVAVSFGAGGLAVGQPFGEGGQVRAGHAGQGRVGEQVGQAGPWRTVAAA